MREKETSLGGELLTREEELNIVYEGPSFEERMEISSLTSQLRSTEIVIEEIVSELYKQKGLKKPEDVKIYIKLKRGSFWETISIIFNNPIVANIIGGCIVALFTYLLTKKKDSPTYNIIKIDNLINNYYLAKNLNQIIMPLEEEKDIVKIVSFDPKINTIITKNMKKELRKRLKELKDQLIIDVYEEEFFGYLSVIDIDREKYGFTLEGTDRHILAVFDKKPKLEEIKNILGYRLKIKARATYEEKELKRLDIKNYEIKRRINLNDFHKSK